MNNMRIENKSHKIVLTATLIVLLFATFTITITASATAATTTAAEDAELNLDAIQTIQSAIKEKGANWTAGETSVSGLSEEEKRKLCGLNLTVKTKPKVAQVAGEEGKIKPVGDYPNSFDWRDNGGDWTTLIKDQGSCGSCWAFGSLAALEAQIDIAANESVVDANLSEQYMLSCSAGGCDGWTLHDTMNFLRDTGTTDEVCFPYEADDTVPCGNACPYCEGRKWNITSWNWVNLTGTPTVDEVKEYLQDRPLVTGMDIYEDFYDYTGGVYEHVTGAYKGGHCVAIVGWNDTEQCWICKNSWDTDWGENGWFRIKWGECNIEYWSLHSEFNLTPRVISCDVGNTEKDSFAVGDNVSIKALGLAPNTTYKVWIQPEPVNENDALLPEKDPSSSQENVTTDANGNILSPLIWPILPPEAPVCSEYDIVLDNQEAGTIGTYNAADDAMDSRNAAGILAPNPEATASVHNLNTSEDFYTIQAAIDDSNTTAGHMIEVGDGTYSENVNVSKRLTIRSENGSDSTIVQAESPDDHVFNVTVDYVNISGFTVKGATGWQQAGIYLGSGIDHCNISNNNATGNYHGIRLYYAGSSNMVTGNTMNTNSKSGIQVYYTDYNIVTGNIVNYNTDYGIYLYKSNDNEIRGNTVNANNKNGIHLYRADDNEITCNWVAHNVKTGFYLTYGSGDGSTGNNISYNNIMSNGVHNATSNGWEWNFYNAQTDAVTAEHNYWGTDNLTVIAAGIKEGTGTVSYSNIQTDPVQCAPIPEAATVVLLATGLLALVGYVRYRRKKED